MLNHQEYDPERSALNQETLAVGGNIQEVSPKDMQSSHVSE